MQEDAETLRSGEIGCLRCWRCSRSPCICYGRGKVGSVQGKKAENLLGKLPVAPQRRAKGLLCVETSPQCWGGLEPAVAVPVVMQTAWPATGQWLWVAGAQ